MIQFRIIIDLLLLLYSSLVFFILEHFVRLSLTLTLLKVTANYFVEVPQCRVICFLMIGFRLCIFGRIITEMML